MIKVLINAVVLSLLRMKYFLKRKECNQNILDKFNIICVNKQEKCPPGYPDIIIIPTGNSILTCNTRITFLGQLLKKYWSVKQITLTSIYFTSALSKVSGYLVRGANCKDSILKNRVYYSSNYVKSDTYHTKQQINTIVLRIVVAILGIDRVKQNDQCVDKSEAWVCKCIPCFTA